MRLRKVKGWALGIACWSLLAVLSAAVTTLIVVPATPAPQFGLDLVRTTQGADPHWRRQPIPAAAAKLFFAGSKGPRADLEGAADGDSEPHAQPPEPTRVELASIIAGNSGSQANSLQSPAAALSSLLSGTDRSAEQHCLAEVIYHEARGQTVEAQTAVGQTVINRALSGVFPRTLCGVVHQHGASGRDCQYSFVCDGLAGISKEPSDWELALKIAQELLNGQVWLPEIGDATHLHPLSEHPDWANALERVKRIGTLVFYRSNFAASR